MIPSARQILRASEPNDLPIKVLLKAVHLNALEGARQRGSDLADTEVNAILRWALDTVAAWTATCRACAGMPDERVAYEIEDYWPRYQLLEMALRGRVILVLEGGQVAGKQYTRAARAELVDWLA